MTPNTFHAKPRTSLPASPEGLTGGAALEDDDRDDQDPPGQQVEARNDQQDQPEDHSERGQDAGDDDRDQLRAHTRKRLAQGEVGAAVTDVVDGFDQRALEPERRDQGHQRREDPCGPVVQEQRSTRLTSPTAT